MNNSHSVATGHSTPHSSCPRAITCPSPQLYFNNSWSPQSLEAPMRWSCWASCCLHLVIKKGKHVAIAPSFDILISHIHYNKNNNETQRIEASVVTGLYSKQPAIWLFVWWDLNFLSSGCRKKLSSLCSGQSQTKRYLEQKVKLTYPEPICLLPRISS